MRGRLLDATVECLCSLGYSRMSTNDVVKRARVSRGALAHHFPTKTDLVVAAANHVIAARAEEFRRRFGDLPPEQRTVARGLDVLWTLFEDQSFVALVELTVAARSDPELRAVFTDAPDYVADLAQTIFGEFFPGLAGMPFADTALRGIIAMYTGLAVQTFVDGDAHGKHAAVRELLKTVLSQAAASMRSKA